MRLRPAHVLAACLLAPAAAAQSFSYPDFSSIAGLQLNGNAAQSGNALRVTPAQNGQKGSVFYDQPVRVAGGFLCTFEFQITNSSGADGMTFIMHNAATGLNALGDDGSGMGYARNSSTSIENALVIELDTYNSGQGDPNANHVSIHTGGTGPNDYTESQSIGNAIPAADMKAGGVHTVVVAYDGTTIEVFFDDLVTPLVSAPWDFATGGTYLNGNPAGGLTLINGDSAYVGFTAGTGGLNENHDVLSWEWQDGGGPVGAPYCGPANLNSSGQAAMIAGQGSATAAHNNLILTATQCAPNETGLFLVSQNTGFTSPPSTSGNLCISHPIGRYLGSLQSTGAAGEMTSPLDLTQTPTGSGMVAIQAGETWYFQAWFTDGSSSNFTDGLVVMFQ